MIGYINIKGEEVTSPNLNEDSRHDGKFSPVINNDDFSIVITSTFWGTPMLYGDGYVTDKSGNVVFTLDENMEFVDTVFSEGLTAVKSKSSNKYGFINTDGEIVIPFVLDHRSRFLCGVAAMPWIKAGYINKMGEYIISFATSQYETTICNGFYEDSAIVYQSIGAVKTVYLFEIVRK